ncbi:MAG TPA: hypothetical protein VI299_08795 [Polyangiales bacterium]
MLIAFFIWLLTKLGVSIRPERLHELEDEFYRRPTLVSVHFGRAFISDASDARIFGIGYQRYPGTQRYFGVGMTTDIVMPRDVHAIGHAEFMIALQAVAHPVRALELSYAFGGYWKQPHELEPFNRWGIGYRVMAVKLAPVPSVWLDLVGKEPRFLIGAALEF